MTPAQETPKGVPLSGGNADNTTVMMLLSVLLIACATPQPSHGSTRHAAETGTVDTGEDSHPNHGDDTSADTAVDEYVYHPPSMTICDATEAVAHGDLCAIQPSRLDANSRDQFADDSVSDRNLGFGYHVIGFPSEGTTIKGVYLHFGGSMGRPYHQGTGTYPSHVILDEAMLAGHIVIQIAYHNRYAVNSAEECVGATDVDNCAGDVRLEKITGIDHSTVVDTPEADAIIPRLHAVFSYLDAVGFVLPLEAIVNGEINWGVFRIGGHSQGAGHALYITKYWNSHHTCLLGGGFDVADAVPSLPAENIADWILDTAAPVDVTKLQALLSVDDDAYDAFVHAYGILGMEENVHWMSFSAATYQDSNGEEINGHSAVVKDPAYQAERHATCFE